jgi:hypothetical protein
MKSIEARCKSIEEIEAEEKALDELMWQKEQMRKNDQNLN